MPKTNEKPSIIVHGDYIDIHDNTFHGGTFNVTDVAKKNRQQELNLPPELDNTAARAVLHKFVAAGLLTEYFMPAERLSRGEAAMLAHDIAERLKMQKFWSVFEDLWQLKYLRTYYCRYTASSEAAEMLKRLNTI